MKIAIAGLGLIGASISKAFKENTDYTILGYDNDHSVLSYALLSDTIDDKLDDTSIGECDVVFIALYPDDTIDFLQSKASIIKKGAFVIDTCGTKRKVCKACFDIAKKNGFTFIGGHPMAGVQYSGIKYSRANMFKSASMVIVPPYFDDIKLLERVKEILSPLCLAKITISTAEKHDKMIAYTSQLAHVVSSAYVKSEISKNHRGFSAGSYKDMTRVAAMNEKMWTELFIENGDNLSSEIGNLIDELAKFKNAIDSKNSKDLIELIADGVERKKKSDR